MSTFVITQNVKFSGVEVHIYIPFTLIKQRVQIGINLAGGAGKISGNLLETQHDVDVTFNPRTGMQIATPKTTVSTKPVTDEVDIKTIPLAHIGAVVAVLVHPSLKVRWEGGLILPGYSVFRIMATYLIGAH